MLGISLEAVWGYQNRVWGICLRMKIIVTICGEVWRMALRPNYGLVFCGRLAVGALGVESPHGEPLLSLSEGIIHIITGISR